MLWSNGGLKEWERDREGNRKNRRSLLGVKGCYRRGTEQTTK